MTVLNINPSDDRFESTARRVRLARLISFFGSSFSEFAIPLFVFSKTHNVTHVGLQWALLALTRIIGGYFAPRITFFRSDKSALVWIDCALGLTTLLPILMYQLAPIPGAYLCTFLMTFLTTIQNGYIDSFVGHAAEGTPNKDASKTYLMSIIENGRHLGSLSGYVAAFLVAQNLGFKVAFLIDSITFFASAAVISSVSIEGAVNLGKKTKYVFSEFLKTPLNFLIFSHMLLSFAIFLFNGSYIVVLKRNFHSTDAYVTLFFMCQYLGYVIGSFLPGWYGRNYGDVVPDKFVTASRLLFPFIFLGFALSTTPFQFIFVNFVLSALIGVSLPSTMVLYQRYVAPAQFRSLGASRVALVSTAGSLGAALSSYMIAGQNFRHIYFLAVLVSLFSCLFTWGFWLKREVGQNA